MRRGARASITRLFLIPILALLFVPPASAKAIPRSLRDLVMGAGHRSIVEIALDGAKFHGLAPFSAVPYVMWPAEGASGGVSHDQAEAAAWIRRSAPALGHRDFLPRYLETTRWRENEVWSYELVREGLVLHDARVDLHWKDGVLVGLVNDVPLPIQSIEDVSSIAKGGDVEHAYTPRRAKGGYALRLARVERKAANGRQHFSLAIDGKTVRRIVSPLASTATPTAAIEEWAVPQGSFPDQIDIDSSGLVWFSQPPDNVVTSFDPETETFTQHATTGGTTPDGMMVDGDDRVWTGLYDGSGLGKLEIASGVFTTTAVPYAPSAPAVPNETSGGTVWLTDHAFNRISEFDPASGTWLHSLDMPTPNCWVVGGTEDPASLDNYFTEYQADQLGRKVFGGPILDIELPAGSAPAFAAHANGFIYFSEWNRDRLGAYEIATGIVTEYDYPVADEVGGPIDATPGGLVAVGTRNVGYIMVFDPASSSFTSHPIPQEFAGLKDGLRSDSNGSIWFTESGANRIAVLHLGPLAPTAEFSGSPVAGVAPLTVEFSDLSSHAPTTWSWSFGDSGGSSLPSPTHEYTAPGLYTVALTATNELGSSTVTKVDYITVIPACPLAPADVAISGKRVNQDVVFTWAGHADCQWAVHRAVVPQDILVAPPIGMVVLPLYRDHAPPEPLVFYNIAPANEDPP